MSKRESHPENPANAPEAKKLKFNEQILKHPEQPENIAPQQRPNSPIAGPSSASSDPDLQVSLHTGLIPIYHYYDHTRMQDNSSQGSSAVDIIGPSNSTVTTSSTNAEFGDSRTSSVENMDVDSDLTTTESSTSTDRRDFNDNNEKSQSGQ